MNNKNHWPLAIFVSVLFHIIILLIIALFWPATPADQKIPAEIFIAEQQPPSTANSQTIDAPEPTTATDTNNTISSKVAPAKKVPTEQQKNKSLSAPAKPTLPIPPQYDIPSLSGQNLAKVPLNISFPKPITTPKTIELPDSLSPDTTNLSTTILFMVTADGHVKAKVEKSSGNKDFDNAALRTIYTWRFKKMSTDFPIPSEQIFTWPISH